MQLVFQRCCVALRHRHPQKEKRKAKTKEEHQTAADFHASKVIVKKKEGAEIFPDFSRPHFLEIQEKQPQKGESNRDLFQTFTQLLFPR